MVAVGPEVKPPVWRQTQKTVEKAVKPAKAVKATAASKVIKKEPALAAIALTRRNSSQIANP
jgi:hypothetical protein